MTDHPKYVTYRIGDDWEALYVDGKLRRAGDAYLIDEEIRDIFNVEYGESIVMANEVQTYDDVPDTLDELRERETVAQGRKRQAEELRAQAEQLRKQADELEGVSRG